MANNSCAEGRTVPFIDPQNDEPDRRLLAYHTERGNQPFKALVQQLTFTGFLGPVVRHFELTEYSPLSPSRLIASQVVTSVWRSLIPVWDDRLAGRPNRDNGLRFEEEILNQRVGDLMDYRRLMARYEGVVRWTGEDVPSVLSDLICTDVSVALMMEFSRSSVDMWRIDSIPGMTMVAEFVSGKWLWQVNSTIDGLGNRYGYEMTLDAALNCIIETVTGIAPAEALATAEDHGLLS